MEEKKHIDRLFQEKLKDFEKFPEPHVWEQIEQRLTKKKRKRIVPLWLRLGSAAAILLLLTSTGFWFFNQDNIKKSTPTNPVPSIIDSETKQPVIIKQDNVTIEETKRQKDNTQLNEINSQEQERALNNNTIAKQTQESLKTTTNSEKEIVEIHQIADQKNDVAKRKQLEETIKDSKEQDQNKIQNPNEKINELLKKETEAVANNQKSKQNDFELTKDDIANAIEDELNDKNVIDDADKKWSVGTTIAPVYFNTLSEGSPINPSLAGNNKETNASLSYGVKVNYRVNDRLSIQSGISSVEMAYKTQGVTALIASRELKPSGTNIDTNISGISLIAISNNQIANQSSELNSQRGILNLRGDLNQSLSYIEVPIEAKYALLNKKFGVHVVGGLSTYVLYENQISLLNQNGSTTLGEASNVNDINFSGNLGLDFDYELGKKLFINVSPMFKYQMNTFSKNSGGFKPYYLGVYTGLNFRF